MLNALLRINRPAIFLIILFLYLSIALFPSFGFSIHLTMPKLNDNEIENFSLTNLYPFRITIDNKGIYSKPVTEHFDEISMSFPSNLSLKRTTDSRNFSINESSLNPIISIKEYPTAEFDLESLVNDEVNSIKENYPNFSLINLVNSTMAKMPAYMIQYSYDEINNSKVYVVSKYITIKDKVVVFTYREEKDRYIENLPIAEGILNSLSVNTSNTKNDNIPTLKLAKIAGMTLDPDTNTLYLVDGSGTLFVFDTSKNDKIKDVLVGSRPNDLAFIKNYYLFVVNSGDNSVSVIDLDTKIVVKTITTGVTPVSIATDSNKNHLLVFVTNMESDTLSVISGNTFKTQNNITVGNRPYGVDVNPLTNRIYVANSGSNTVSIIDYFVNSSSNFIKTNQSINIPVGENPTHVAVNPLTNMIYVSSKDGLSVINGSSNRVTKTISLPDKPGSLAIDKQNNRIWVSSVITPRLYIIEGKTYGKSNVSLSTIPSRISIDQKHNIAYVGSSNSDKFYIINTTSTNFLVGNKLVVNNFKDGHFECNDKVYGSENNNYFIYESKPGYHANCKIIYEPKVKLKSFSWKFQSNSSVLELDPEKPMFVSNGYGYGTLTAMLDPITLPEYITDNRDWIIALLTGVILAPIVQLVMPHILIKREREKQLGHVKDHVSSIEKIYDKHHKNKIECLNILEKKYLEFVELLKEGKINDFTFQSLTSILSKYIIELTKK
jgi:YVTN family beta-propeller protein